MSECIGCKLKLPLISNTHYDDNRFPTMECTKPFTPNKPSWVKGKLTNLVTTMGTLFLMLFSFKNKSKYKEGQGMPCEGCPTGRAFFSHKVESYKSEDSSVKHLCPPCLQQEKV